MSDDIVFRDAIRDDLPAIIALLADDGLGHHREAPGDTVHPDYLAAFDRLAGQPHNRQLVAVRDGGVVGCLQITLIAGLSRRGALRMQIEGVRVAKSARGGGIGFKLMHHAIETARSEGCSLVQLTTDRDRPDAHRFYESLGFVASHVGMKLPLDMA